MYPDLSFLSDPREFDGKTNPFSEEEIEALAYAAGGQAGVEEYRQMQKSLKDGSWRANSIGGYGSRHCKDIHVMALNNKFSIVYWGGDAAEAGHIWSFHIARARPNATRFNEYLDRPVTLAEERLRVLVLEGRIALREGVLVTPEGSSVWFEHSPVNGPQTIIPITFPIRQPRNVYPGGVVSPTKSN